ncbi:DNA polymerase III subunit alpha [Thiohalomonas denitrificans]|uniref:DNA polymerase III subunit alpha n=1 Tax=Thiohalomonas denitrificans TaxID=415747 RepID=A0A1G5Q397_9GAMM|nr:DNA polymerase III subunit alpha [Thiohalomonas denitrificans]SCZ56016.1 DNA polymerase III, alpha subunit [Thiohalomonas denitrificans]
MTPTFCHLRIHTEYSLVDGIVRIKPLVKAAAEAGMPAVALTDQCNLFALVKFYGAAQRAGVKPIVGVDLWLEDETEDPTREGPGQSTRLLLLCKDEIGYRHLTELVSRSYIENQHGGVPMIKKSWLTADSTRGLIALSGGREGDVGRAILDGKREVAARLLTEWIRLFGDNFYLELMRTGREGEEDYLHGAIELAMAMGVPVVATNDVRFLDKGDYDSHEVRVCIHEGRTLDDPRRSRRYSEQQYLRSPQEMAELFSDIPEALENSVEIARRCNLELKLGTYYLPDFPVPAGMTMDEYFRQLSREGLENRLKTLFDTEAPEFSELRRPYDERLERELGVITQMGFPGYFLIVADFIRWAKGNGVPVGPGRGSGAGSLVAYALTITDLDPLAYDLLFERFLNPERVSMPDFDVDFCMEGRDRVIDYVAEHYGRDKVSQIITYGTMAAKAVVRDVGRVLGHPYGFVDQISKLIPFEVGISLEKAMEDEPQLRERYEREDEVHDLIDMAQSLEGITRNAGKHAGGVVISPSKLTDFAPLFCEPGGQGLVTQFDKNDVESVGLVKFDFLGLRTLTIIDWALENIRQASGEEVDIATIPLDDRPVFDLLKACRTTAVFQLESRGMKELISRLQPDSFEEIIALVALFRPGPLQSGMVDNFINRKHGRETVSYPDPQYQHDLLKPILEPTYGIILYQEQVMQIAQALAGYTLGGADLLRRAMGKKKAEEMAKQRAVFQEGAEKNGIDPNLAIKIFDLVEKFAGYGFNKSHSAAYALVSYQTAWLKAHYPASFMAAVLSADMDNTDKVVTLIDECNSMGLDVVPPSVNTSAYKFTVREDGAVVYGLGAIKGVGEGAIASIVEERAHGPYQDLFDFCKRVDLKKANRRVMEALIRAGALDSIGPNRATMAAALPDALRIAEKHLQNAQAGMEDLFGFGTASEPGEGAYEYEVVPEWDDDIRLTGEKETLGLWLTGHPITRHEAELRHFITAPIVRLAPQKGKNQVLAGLVSGMRVMTTRRGDKMAIVTLDDRTARIDLKLFSEVFERARDKLGKDRLVVVKGEVGVDDYSGGNSVSVEEVYELGEARQVFGHGVIIDLDEESLNESLMDDLAAALRASGEGQCPVVIAYHNQKGSALAVLGHAWRVLPSEELMARLHRLLGPERVQIDYDRVSRHMPSLPEPQPFEA